VKFYYARSAPVAPLLLLGLLKSRQTPLVNVIDLMGDLDAQLPASAPNKKDFPAPNNTELGLCLAGEFERLSMKPNLD
jgi:hypothetical protein